nr:hypothetical protein [Devosia sp.]
MDRQLAAWLTEQLALEVPERDIERRKRSGGCPFRPQLNACVIERIQQYGVVQYVLTDEERGHIGGNDDEGSTPTLHRGRFPHAELAILGFDPHKSGALFGLVSSKTN